MNKQKLIEKLAIKMAADYNLDYDTELKGPSWVGEATTAVEMFWPLVEKAANFDRTRNIPGYDDHAEKSAGWYLCQALSNLKGEGQ